MPQQARESSVCVSALGAVFNAMVGIDALHIPFLGSGPALAALLGGQVDYGIDTLAVALKLVQEGQLRALGLTTAQPSRFVPEIPPIASAGGPTDYDIGGWNGLMVPTGTPQPIIDRLVTEVQQGLATPALRKHFVKNPPGPPRGGWSVLLSMAGALGSSSQR